MKENLAQMKIHRQEMKNIGEYFKICFFARNPCWPKFFPAGIDKTPPGSFAQNENPPR